MRTLEIELESGDARELCGALQEHWAGIRQEAASLGLATSPNWDQDLSIEQGRGSLLSNFAVGFVTSAAYDLWKVVVWPRLKKHFGHRISTIK